MLNEKNDLKTLGDALLAFKKEIKIRKDNIITLKKEISPLNDNNVLNSRDVNSSMLNVIRTIQSLRLNSVKLVKIFLSIREKLTYYSIIGKFNLEDIKNNYNFDLDFLLKMKEELKFLKEFSGLNKYFDVDKIDIFFSNFVPNNNNIETNINIQIPENLKKDIESLNYIILQEKLLNLMKNVNNKDDSNIYRLKRTLNFMGINFKDKIFEENDKLKKEIESMKQYLKERKKKYEEEEKEREKIEFKRHKQIKQRELEFELDYKKLYKEKEEIFNKNNVLKGKIQSIESENEQNKNKIENIVMKISVQNEELRKSRDEFNLSSNKLINK